MSVRIRVDMEPVGKTLRRLGLEKNGAVQQELTRIVCKRLSRYMPYRNGFLSNISKRVISPREIYIAAPYAHYQYAGKVRVNEKTGKGPALIPGVGYRYRKGTVTKPTERALQYDTTTKNSRAGPMWDKRLMAAEGDAIAADVQNFVRGRQK